ncbi:nuclease [Tepidicaulis marinus]|uniref:Nuclease n=1 Tax=Tepidicaulis marinus TaxID=1333998 RepID=A0A081B6G0_9HYPH|nr:ParB N-terminal domain-containing protein [Tepidicaulis marinus]GAK43628.1 nuclease [Tepidicaulis marinus]
MSVMRQVSLSEIKVGQRLRRVDPDHVEVIAQSMRDCGKVLTPLTVREDKKSGEVHLIAGAHRLAAAKKAGFETVPCEIHKNLSPAEARLMEIDENLCRHELNPLDRAAFLAERKAVYETLYPATKAGVAGANARHGSANDMMSFADDIAEKTGWSKRTIERHVRLHQRLDPQARKKIIGTDIARNQSELLSLVRFEPERQREIVKLLMQGDGEIKRVGQAAAKLEGRSTGPDKQSREAKVARAVEAWNRLDKRGQDMLLDHIGIERLYTFLNSRTPKLEVAD